MKAGKMRGLLWVVMVCFMTVAVSCSYEYDFDLAEELEKLNEDVKVEQNGKDIVLIPEEAVCGFVFYPGAKVAFESYLPLLVRCANEGILCAVVDMPLDYAFNGINRAGAFPGRYSQVKDWYVGGHSLGGAMAASFVGKADGFAGLVLLASFSTADLSESGLKVLSVYGSNDGVLNMESYSKYRKNLPSDFVEVVVDGGNHAGFGNYGAQKGDGEAAVSSEVQQEITARAIVELVNGGGAGAVNAGVENLNVKDLNVKDSENNTGSVFDFDSLLAGVQKGPEGFVSVSMDRGCEMMTHDSGFVLVDVRRQDEYDAGHIPGAVLLTNELITEERAFSVLSDREQRIYVYCRSGRRSKEASAKLAAMGYGSVIEIGGVLDYAGSLEM